MVLDLGRRLVVAVVYLEEDLADAPPPPPPPAALGVFSAAPDEPQDDLALPSGEALSAELPGIGELARLGTASALVGTDDTVPSAAASDMVVGCEVSGCGLWHVLVLVSVMPGFVNAKKDTKTQKLEK